jgi:murein L,D-transpeptidase YafK
MSASLKLLFTRLLTTPVSISKGRRLLFCFLVFMAVCGMTAAAQAQQPGQSWKATLSNHNNAPTLLIAVDKQEQRLFAYERHSPMRLIAEFPCTTGQAQGDKFTNGDHKTPEGIYFVVQHITAGLNYTLYGKEAYPLNYPNPVDRLQNKTGYGIWLHGKGVPLTPQDTKGCVGMNNQDIAALGQKIRLGQPVAIAEHIEYQDEPSTTRAADFAALQNQVHAWARAWDNRSPEMFDFYDADAYSVTQKQPFKAFRAQKERVFKAISRIDNKINDLQILEGPGYWVTWFNHKYDAPNLKTSGTRRLYWQKNAEGNLRIVGMEWLPGLTSPVMLASADANMTALPDTASSTAALIREIAQSSEKAVSSAGQPDNISDEDYGRVNALLLDWKTAWKNADIAAYADFYAKNAVQSGLGFNRMLASKKILWARATPQEIVFDSINITKAAHGFKVKFLQTYTDIGGYSDKGVKTLLLENKNGILLITREDWKPVKQAVSR